MWSIEPFPLPKICPRSKWRPVHETWLDNFFTTVIFHLAFKAKFLLFFHQAIENTVLFKLTVSIGDSLNIQQLTQNSIVCVYVTIFHFNVSLSLFKDGSFALSIFRPVIGILWAFLIQLNSARCGEWSTTRDDMRNAQRIAMGIANLCQQVFDCQTATDNRRFQLKFIGNGKSKDNVFHNWRQRSHESNWYTKLSFPPAFFPVRTCCFSSIDGFNSIFYWLNGCEFQLLLLTRSLFLAHEKKMRIIVNRASTSFRRKTVDAVRGCARVISLIPFSVSIVFIGFFNWFDFPFDYSHSVRPHTSLSSRIILPAISNSMQSTSHNNFGVNKWNKPLA